MPENQRYRITEKLDAGGMAEVYRGIAESAVGGIKKAVAIKKILPSLTKNKKFVAMFLDEARVSMHLQHANVVGVFDIGMADTAYFIVMEYVDGANLKGILESLRRQGKRLSVAQVLYLMMEVCKGLHYAHEVTDAETGRPLGIVHRDISPPNILISRRGEVKLVDFGLAKASSQLETTDPGVVKGKFSYLSPEAAAGKEVDRRADIFAVGILLYELLTGKRLFYGETDYQTVELVRQAKVPPIGPQNPDVQPELEGIIRKALARDLGTRYQTAADLQDAIAQYLFGQRLKVTSRDIEQLVQSCLHEKQRSQPVVQQANLIDQLINDEMLKFTSLDDLDAPASAVGGNSPSPVGGGQAPLDPGSFVDTRGWVDDLAGARQKGGRLESIQEIESLGDLLEGDARGRPGQALPTQPPLPSPGYSDGSTAPNVPRPAQTTGGVAAPAARPGGAGKTIALVVVLLVLVAGAGAAVFLLR